MIAKIAHRARAVTVAAVVVRPTKRAKNAHALLSRLAKLKGKGSVTNRQFWLPDTSR